MSTLSAGDVIVVGAGPAGATAALFLARMGRRVTLIDRESFPRDKACGDLIGTFAIALLRRFEIDLEVVRASPPLHGAFVHAPDGRRIGATVAATTAQRLGARVIRRAIFDEALVTAARRAGTTFHRGRVTAVIYDAAGAIVGVRLASGAEMRAPLTIGADGWSSVVARAVIQTPRATRDIAIATRTYVEGVDAGRVMRFFIGAPGDGYGWIFPLPNGAANVGLGCIRAEPGASALHAAFERFLQRAELRSAHEMGLRQTWPIPLGPRAAPIHAAGALLAGDAASLASSLSGSGIHTAIASGAVAAEVADSALHRADFSAASLRAYDVRLSPIARRLGFERWLHGRVGTPSGSSRSIGIANCVPGTGRLAVGWLLSLG